MGCRASDAKPALKEVGLVDTLVINSVRPFALPAPMRPGAAPSAAAMYRWKSGDSSLLATPQTILCVHRGDVTIAGDSSDARRQIVVRCRPVVAARLATPIQMLLGDSSQMLHVAAYDRDSTPVSLLSGTVTIRDSTVARLNGLQITPLRAGATSISFRIGEQEARGSVHVYERVKSLDELQQRIRLVAVPLALEAGEMRRWRLPRGTWMLSMWPDDDVGQGPRLRVEGGNCSANIGISRRRMTCLSAGMASVIVYVPRDVRTPAPGVLAVRPVNGTEKDSVAR
jgi:hypothetical protein